MKKIEPKAVKKAANVKIIENTVFPRSLLNIKPKKPAGPDFNLNLEELRTLKDVVLKLQGKVEELIRLQGSFVQDFHTMQRNLFQTGLKQGLKNKKKLKAEFDAKDDPLLKKCGVKKKILTSEDVERIKSRIDLK